MPICFPIFIFSFQFFLPFFTFFFAILSFLQYFSTFCYMQDHNSKGDEMHSLALNRFADWHKEEFLATMLPNHGKPRPALPLEGQQALMHKPRLPEHMLPTTLDWRGSGADSPVKDQASCGSCWVCCSLAPDIKLKCFLLLYPSSSRTLFLLHLQYWIQPMGFQKPN